ncbi:MAG: aminotransferase class III-fold pyridoxal phosphate-dependent enzyme, partial [Thermomicrobiales bacterium]
KWAPGSHGGTYGGNAVGTAAAYATMQVMLDEDLPCNSERMGAILMDGLRDIQADYPVIGDVRGLGLMVATEFVHPDGSPNPGVVNQVLAKMMEERILLITCGTYDQAIRIIPPLVVNEEQIRSFLGHYRNAVASL